MNKIRTHRMVLAVITIICAGYAIESVIQGWEFWVPPLLIVGAVILWALHVSQRGTEPGRERLYFLYGLSLVFFYGVHESGFFDAAIVAAVMLVMFSLFDRVYALNLILAEYALIMALQFFLGLHSGGNESVTLDPSGVSKAVLRIAAFLCVYLLCRRSVSARRETALALERRNAEIEKYDSEMEDFLTNISHELRTPINVVNGMSTLLIKKGAGAEAEAVREAGVRLACQVEDIQDYTEIRQGEMVVEEERYMCASLINDVVAGFRRYQKADTLELVVDLDPNVPAMMRGDIRKLRKLFRHLLDNAVKFTERGGVYIRVYAVPQDYGVNLCIEITDTGRGMTRRDIAAAAKGLYQANRKRNRSTGGIGLGLPVVYGLAHAMGGFIKIESEKGKGTTVRATIPQKVADAAPCLRLDPGFAGDVLFHVRSEKYRVPQVREFNRSMAVNLATGLRYPLYPAETAREVERLLKQKNVTYIFMGQEEYEADPAYFDGLSRGGIVVAVSAHPDFRASAGSEVIVMPKPLYGVPVVRVLNEGRDAAGMEDGGASHRPVFDGVRALIVDDEPMNLVVATGLFREYKMKIDTADSGAEAIQKFLHSEYDVIFMDHMMPEMDGVEAMKRLREAAAETGRSPAVIALTANAVSGARERFLREGFDGFIAKPIDMGDFERVMKRVLPEAAVRFEGGGAI